MDDNVIKEIKSQITTEFKSILTTVKEDSQKTAKLVADVQDEVKRFGTDDALSKDKYEKMTSDATKAMESIQAMSGRMDEIETDINRLETASATVEESDECKTFTNHCAATTGEKHSFTDTELKSYTKAFDSYLRKGDNTKLSADEVKFLSRGSDPGGGYTVTPAISSEIVKRIRETSPVRSVASVQTIGTDRLEILVDIEDAGAEWVGETSATTDSTNPTFAKIVIPVHELATEPKATRQLIEDSNINIPSWLAEKVANKFSRTEATAFITGDGVSKPRGLLTYASGTSWGQVEQTNSGSITGATYQGLVDITYSLEEPYQANASWLMNRTTLAAIMKIQDGDSAFAFLSSFEANGAFKPTLAGRPVNMAADMPVPASTSLSFIYGDIRAAYQVVDRVGITVDVDPFTGKPFIKFYTRGRVGGDIKDFRGLIIGVCTVIS